MLAKAFPNLEWLKKQANTAFADRKDLDGSPLAHPGWPNVIMNATANSIVRDHIRGPLSVFTNVSGKSAVTVEGKRATVMPGILYLSNAGQSYTLEIDRTPAQTSNIHFGEAFAQGALRSLVTRGSDLLEPNPEKTSTDFFNRIIRVGPEMQGILNRLTTPGKDPLEEEELLYGFLEQLVEDEMGLVRQSKSISAVKASTRKEVLKRLLQVTDYLHSSPEAQPDLDELARISCLSKFHFLRLFRMAFGETPYQYIARLKLERATDLLKHSSNDVKTIAQSLGFRDASTFSRLFHRHRGIYPTEYRATA